MDWTCIRRPRRLVPRYFVEGQGVRKIHKLQGFLNNWIKQFPGPDKPAQLTVNGVFDLSTETAVRKVQSAANLKEKGVVGSETWQELLKWK